MHTLLPLLLLACADEPETGDGATTTPTTDLTWHQDVQPIVAARCLECHEAGGLSGIPLDSYEAAVSWAPAVAAAVEARTMPPWGADPGCNEYEGDLSLTDDQVETIVQWARGGTPEGDAATPGPALPPVDYPVLDRVDLTLSMAPYTPQGSPDDYRCFLVEWPEAATTYVEGFQVQPASTQVHHVIAFLIAPEDAEQYRALDEADAGEGYTCYGGPGGDIQTLIDTRWLGAWAPGAGASRFPEGSGITVQPGSLVAMQVHYYTPGTAVPDETTVDLQITDTRETWGDLQPWTEVAWLFGDGMDIPAGQSGVTHEFQYQVEPGDGFVFHSAALHMHTLGVTAEMVVEHADGSETCLARVPDWDFNWQRTYRLKEPVSVTGGDTIRLTCTWDNPTDQDVAWGEGTGDEMCLGTTYITGPLD